MSDLRSGILESISRRGLATPKEIAADIEARKGARVDSALVRQAIARMVARKIIVRAGYGRYRLAERHERRSRSVPELTEGLILEYLRSQGGIARTGAISLGDMGSASKGGNDRPYDYQRVVNLRCGNCSPRFRQDYMVGGFGTWTRTNLSGCLVWGVGRHMISRCGRTIPGRSVIVTLKPLGPRSRKLVAISNWLT